MKQRNTPPNALDEVVAHLDLTEDEVVNQGADESSQEHQSVDGNQTTAKAVAEHLSVNEDEKNNPKSDELMAADDLVDESKEEAVKPTQFKQEGTLKNSAKPTWFSAQIERIKKIDFGHIKNRLHLDNEKKEKIKTFTSTNLGITTIVLLVVVVFIGFGVMRNHRSVAPVATSTSWGSAAAKTSERIPGKSTGKKSSRMTKPVNLPSAPVTASQMKSVMQTLQGLRDNITNLNQRMMVISELLASKGHKAPINSHYRVLGWRLDQDTNQWIADIEYQGQVKAYYGGQRFGHWVVRSVNANGVHIK